LHIAKGTGITKMVQKMMFYLANISADSLLHVLGFSFYTEHHFWSIFLNAVHIKNVKNYLHKSCSALALKMLANQPNYLLKGVSITTLFFSKSFSSLTIGQLLPHRMH
jgi:hypothetical protein